VDTAKQQKLLGRTATAAIDATGLDSQYRSHYFSMRAGRPWRRTHFIKPTAVCDTRSQFILAAHVDRGRSNDSPQFPGCIRRAASRTRIRRVRRRAHPLFGLFRLGLQNELRHPERVPSNLPLGSIINDVVDNVDLAIVELHPA